MDTPHPHLWLASRLEVLCYAIHTKERGDFTFVHAHAADTQQTESCIKMWLCPCTGAQNNNEALAASNHVTGFFPLFLLEMKEGWKKRSASGMWWNSLLHTTFHAPEEGVSKTINTTF